MKTRPALPPLDPAQRYSRDRAPFSPAIHKRCISPKHSAVPATKKAGRFRRATPALEIKSMTVYQFPVRRSRPQSSGLFFCMPRSQEERIRQLALTHLSAETISTICRMPLSEIVAIIEGRI
jgi:hypothetical protein